MLYREVWFFEGFKKLVLIILRGRRPSGKSTAIMVTITKNYNNNKVWRYRKKPSFWSLTYLKLFLFLWVVKYNFGSSDNSITGQNHHWWTLIIIFFSFLLCSPWFPPLFSIYFIFGIVPCIITTYGLHFKNSFWSVILYVCSWTL